MRARIGASGLIVSMGCLATCFFAARGSESGEDGLPMQLVQELVDKLKTGDVDGVFASAKKHTILRESESAVIDELEKQCLLTRPNIVARYGKPLGEIDLIRPETLGKSLVRFVYLEKYERLGIIWQFDFYRGRDKWWIASLSYSDNPLNQFPVTQLQVPASRY